MRKKADLMNTVVFIRVFLKGVRGNISVFLFLFVFNGMAQNWSISGSNANTVVDGVAIVARTNSPNGFGSSVMNPSGTNFWSSPNVVNSQALRSQFTWDNSITFEFRDPSTNQLVEVENPVIHIDHLGAIQHVVTVTFFGVFVRSTSFSPLLTIHNGLSWQRLAGTSDFVTNGNNGVYDSSAGSRVYGVTVGTEENPSGNEWRLPAAGSLRINGTVSSFTLTVPHFRGPRAPLGDGIRFFFSDLNRFNNTTAVDDNYNVDYGTTLQGNLLSNDRDDQGDIQNAVPMEIMTAEGGNVVLSESGDFTYIPPPGFSGTDNFVYTVCDDWNPSACDQGEVTIVVEGFSPPDYYPTLFTTNTIVTGGTGYIDFYIALGEANGNNSNGLIPVEVRIPDSDRFTFAFDQGWTAMHGTSIDNGDWSYKEEFGIHKFEYIGNGGIFVGSTLSRIGVRATFNSPSNASGKVPLKVTVKYDSGGQVNIANDNEQDIIEYRNN